MSEARAPMTRQEKKKYFLFYLSIFNYYDLFTSDLDIIITLRKWVDTSLLAKVL